MECLASNNAEDEYFNSSSYFTVNENDLNGTFKPTTSSLSLLTDLAEEIYANDVKRSKSRSSSKNAVPENSIITTVKNSIMIDATNRSKRPKTGRSSNSPMENYEGEDPVYNKKRISIESIKNDLTHLNDSILNKYDRARSALPAEASKHKNVEHGDVSRNVCQVCGPETCHLCDEENQRKALSLREQQQQRQQLHAGDNAPPNSASAKHLKSATNQSNLTVNTKSVISSKAPHSSFDNFYSYHNADNTKLLSIILKNKYNLAGTENEIENMIRNEKLYTLNRSSPFNLAKRATTAGTRPVTTAGGATTARTQMTQSVAFDLINNDDETDIYNNENYVDMMPPNSIISAKTTSKALKEFDEPVSTRKSVDQTLSSLKQFNVTDYYFKNMKDLKNKSFLRKDRLLLSRTPAPTSSNKLFLGIERFDVADKYKKTSSLLHKPSSPGRKPSSSESSTARMKRNLTIASDTAYKPPVKLPVDSFEKYKFVSLKKFQIVEPQFTQLYEPPLLQLKMQKFDEIYEKFQHDRSFKLINRKTRF